MPKRLFSHLERFRVFFPLPNTGSDIVFVMHLMIIFIWSFRYDNSLFFLYLMIFLTWLHFHSWRWLLDSKNGKSQSNSRLYSSWRQSTCKIDKAYLPELSLGQLKCFSCLRRSHDRTSFLKRHTPTFLKDKKTSPTQSHSFGGSVVSSPISAIGYDQKILLIMSLSHSFLFNYVLSEYPYLQ